DDRIELPSVHHARRRPCPLPRRGRLRRRRRPQGTPGPSSPCTRWTPVGSLPSPVGSTVGPLDGWCPIWLPPTFASAKAVHGPHAQPHGPPGWRRHGAARETPGGTGPVPVRAL
ncbi:hypothetical protein CFC21_100682, partial [Triticum aestivum]